MMGEASLIDHLVLLMQSYDHTVVCMQINPAVERIACLLNRVIPSLPRGRAAAVG